MVDSWSIALASGTLTPGVEVGSSPTKLSVSGASGTCVDGGTSTVACTVDLVVNLTSVACSLGAALGSGTATVTIGNDIDTYAFSLVVSPTAGVMVGSLTDDGASGPAAGVVQVAPDMSLAENCALNSVSTVTVTASAMGVLPGV